MDLSAGEVLGLAAVIGLITGVVSVCLAPLLVERFRRRLEADRNRLTTYGLWLTARLTFSRASKDFVTSFRKIERDPDRTPPTDELQRADQSRQRWLAALAEWERQTANLMMCCDDAHIGVTLRSFETPDAHAIRTAIGKGPGDIDRLFAQLDELDRLAALTVRGFVRESRGAWWVPLSRGWAMLRRIAYRLTRP